MENKKLVKLAKKAIKSGLSKSQNRAFITYTVVDNLQNSMDLLDNVLNAPTDELKDKIEEVKELIESTATFLILGIVHNDVDEVRNILESEEDDINKALNTMSILDYDFGVKLNNK